MSFKSSGKGASALGLGCLTLFALPFAGFGVFALIKALQEISAGKWKAGLPLLLFGLVFSGFGFGLFMLGIAGSKKAKREEAIKQAHPEEPWLWREDWSRGEVKSANKHTVVFSWVFALFWNGISSFVFLVPLNVKQKPAAMLAFIFPLIGVGLLLFAMRQTVRWKRYGEATLRLTTLPGLIGGALAGVVHTARPLYRASQIRMHLACVERDTSGDSTSEDLQWEEEKLLTGEVLQGGGIPVVFNIPFDCNSTATLSPTRTVVWRLDVQAQVPGTDYQAQFEVPVFKTAQSRPDAPKLPDPTAAYEVPVNLAPPPGIRIRTASNGGTEFMFGAARNKGAAFGLTLFTIIWIGAIVLMLKLSAPIGFPIVFGLFGLLMVLGVMGMWTGASQVVADAAALDVTNWFCFIRSKKSVPAADVRTIEPKLGMSSGAVTYYDLIATTSGGKKVKLASSIKGKKESEWLAREIQNALSRK